MSDREHGLTGIEDRHKYIAVGVVVINKVWWDEERKAHITLVPELLSKSSINSQSLDPSVAKKTSRINLTPKIPVFKIPGQLSIVIETVHRGESIDKAIVRSIGQPGNNTKDDYAHGYREELSGVRYYQKPIHISTVWQATRDGIIKPGTEEAACAVFLVWNEDAFEDPSRGHYFDVGNPRTFDLDWLLRRDVILRKTLVERRKILEGDEDSVPEGKLALNFYVKEWIKNKTTNYFKMNSSRELVNLGCVNIRPGVLDMLLDAKNYLSRYADNPLKYTPRIHKSMRSCPPLWLF